MLISRKALIVAGLISVYFSVQISPSSIVIAKPIYPYTDDAGVLTLTTEWHSIPEKYRNDIPLRESEPAAKPPAPEEIPASHPPVPAPSTPPSATVRTVKARGEYRMGEHDMRHDAVRLAVEAAKKDALEQVATYLESVTEVRDMNVTRDDIRTYTAGIVKIVEQEITMRLEDETVVVRADLTAEIDPQEVAQAIAALRENESAMQELLALRAETDRLQEQLDATNRALAAMPSPDEAQQLNRRREDMLNELQANGLVSQAWTSVVYATPGFYAYPWIGMSGVHGLLLQAQRLYPRHRHLPLARQMISAQPGHMPPARPGPFASPPHSPLAAPHALQYQSPPLLTPQGVPAKVGDIVSIPAQRSVPPVTHQPAPQPHPYQLHPSHFWRPSSPNIHTSPSVPHYSAPVSPRQFGGYAGGGSRSGEGQSRGGGRGR